jgi:hypothetical protein
MIRRNSKILQQFMHQPERAMAEAVAYGDA